MAKVTDITRTISLSDLWNIKGHSTLAPGRHIAATVTPEDCFLISQPSHSVRLTREQAEFVLPHLQRWLTGDRE